MENGEAITVAAEPLHLCDFGFWCTLPDPVAQIFLSMAVEDLEIKVLRLVCKSWRSCIDSKLSHLKPRDFNRQGVVSSFFHRLIVTPSDVHKSAVSFVA